MQPIYRLLALGLLVGLTACQTRSNDETELIRLNGRTMGTTFAVAYVDSLDRIFDDAIDSLLVEVNNSMSTYIPNSTISTFNSFSDTTFFAIDPHFYHVYRLSKDIYQLTGGAFNPAVMPLVRYWGFGPDDQPDQVDSAVVDSLLSISDFDQVEGAKVQVGDETRYLLKKTDPRIQLDFSAIAKGYGVDVLLAFLLDQGIEHAFVEIGGEIAVAGQPGGNPWLIGIEDPVHSTLQDRQALVYLGLSGGGIATSGNYRNIREIEGVKYTHSIDPATGYSARNTMLSATIIGPDCATADALATACMIVTPEQALQLAGSASCEALFMYSTGSGQIDTLQSAGMAKWIQE